MEIHNEIEFKSMLTKEEYERLLPLYTFKTYTQINDYLDTENGDFAKNKQGCRIRIKNDSYEVTVKTPISELETKEQNWPLTASEYERFLDSRDLSFIDGMFDQPLQSIGTIKTIRSEADYGTGVLMMDHSIFNTSEDFEIEFEVKDAKIGQQEFLDFLTTNHLPYRLAKKKLVRMREDSK
ncbi:CYTH domain-containing protein [Chryseomicrobium sp. FSL W7-1435]|uniref:CYTH domain-containing protein n=1 Tax=Chryseomicrobium sp. FSL W7-1435 TaxID=2921704 RepID=UPI00315AAFBD